MPSMTEIISTIFFDEVLISPMVATTSATTAPPRLAMPAASPASLLAWRALSAFCFTVDVSSSIDEAVSSSELACCSVRDDKSWLPAAISADAVAMVSVPLRTWPTMPTRLSFMVFRACMSWPVSSRLCAVMVLVRSPAATVSATFTASRMGPVIERVIHQAKPMPISTAATPMMMRKRRVLL